MDFGTLIKIKKLFVGLTKCFLAIGDGIIYGIIGDGMIYGFQNNIHVFCGVCSSMHPKKKINYILN